MSRGAAGVRRHLATEWKEQAACAAYPHALFFPAPEASVREIERAKAICSVCPVIDVCLEYSLETNQRSGIWGGTTEAERRSLRRKWLERRRRTA
ncbi:MAG: WhiB family transcriptional regulator [Acidimicrobiia bacterium]